MATEGKVLSSSISFNSFSYSRIQSNVKLFSLTCFEISFQESTRGWSIFFLFSIFSYLLRIYMNLNSHSSFNQTAKENVTNAFLMIMILRSNWNRCVIDFLSLFRIFIDFSRYLCHLEKFYIDHSPYTRSQESRHPSYNTIQEWCRYNCANFFLIELFPILILKFQQRRRLGNYPQINTKIFFQCRFHSEWLSRLLIFNQSPFVHSTECCLRNHYFTTWLTSWSERKKCLRGCFQLELLLLITNSLYIAS